MEDGIVKLSDQKVMEFFWKSPIRSFSAMLDFLRFLDERALPEELEYELFDGIRVPGIGGDSAAVIWRFTKHAEKSGVVRRRARRTKSPLAEEVILVAVYEITAAGRLIMKLLEAIQAAKVI